MFSVSNFTVVMVPSFCLRWKKDFSMLRVVMVPDLASLLALFNVVLDGFGDGGGVFMGNGEGASGGMAGPGDVKVEVVFVHVSVE